MQMRTEAEAQGKPKANVRRWPKTDRPTILDTQPWRVRFYHRGELSPRFRHFATHAEAMAFATTSWWL